MNYEEKIELEILQWERQLIRPPGLLERTSKAIGDHVNNLIPDKVQQVITTTVKTIVRTTLFGAEYTPKGKVQMLALEDADKLAKEAQTLYQKIAVAEGAGTGAGGIMLSMVDFPALLAIKMKFLFELAHIYGFDTRHFSERIFILYIFQLTYSGNTRRQLNLDKIKQWDVEKMQWASDKDYYTKLDWETFQKEYRDAIDFRKMLQMIPGIGAVAGAWANYSIMDELGEAAMNAYRIRRLFDLR